MGILDEGKASCECWPIIVTALHRGIMIAHSVWSALRAVTVRRLAFLNGFAVIAFVACFST